MEGRNFNDVEVKEQFQQLSSQLTKAVEVVQSSPIDSSKSTLSAILALLKEVLSVKHNPLTLIEIFKLNQLVEIGWSVVALKNLPLVLVRLSSSASLAVAAIIQRKIALENSTSAPVAPLLITRRTSVQHCFQRNSAICVTTGTWEIWLSDTRSEV